MACDELNLDQDWSMGEAAFAALVREFRAKGVHTIVEFGSGRSSVRLAREFPEALIYSIEHSPIYYKLMTHLITDQAAVKNLKLHFRPLRWQVHSGAAYLSYAVGPFPSKIDAVIVDGPPWWTRRGREACLYQVLDKLRVGGSVYLDDLSRPGEQKIVHNWMKTVGQAFRFRHLDVGHQWCVLEKQEVVGHPRMQLSVVIDSWEQYLRWAYVAVHKRMALIGQRFERNPSLKQHD